MSKPNCNCSQVRMMKKQAELVNISGGAKSQSPPPRVSTGSVAKKELEPTKDNAKKEFHRLAAVTDKAFTQSQNELNRAMGGVKAKSAELEKRAKEQVDRVLAPLKKGLDELIAKAEGKGFDIAESQHLIDKFANTSDDTIHNLTDRFNQEISKAQGYVDDALNNANKMKQDVNSIDQDIDKCHGDKSMLEKCYADIMGRISKQTIEVPRRMTENVNKTTALVSGIIPILEECMTNQVAKAGKDAAKNVTDVKEMVEQVKTPRGSKSQSPPPRGSTGSDPKEELKPTKDNAKRWFHRLKAAADKALTQAQNKLNKTMDEVKAKSAELEKRAKEQVDKALAPLRKDLDEHIAKAKEKGSDIAESQNLIDNFSNTRDEMLHNLTDGFNQEISKVQGYVDEALNNVNKMKQDLNSIDQEINNSDGDESMLEKIMEKIAKDTLEVPRRITENVNKATALVSEIGPILEERMTNQVSKAVENAAKNVTEIKEMADLATISGGAKPQSPPPPPATESVAKEDLELTKDKTKIEFHRLVAVTDTALTNAQNELNKALDKVKAKSAELEKRAKDQVDKALVPLRKNLDEIIAKAEEKGFDIAECQHLIDKFSNTSDDTVHNLTDRFHQEISKAQGYVDDALNNANKMKQDVNSIDQDIDNCHGDKSMIEKCYADIRGRIAKEAIEVPRRMTENVNKTTALVSGIVPILEQYMTNQVTKAGKDAAKNVTDVKEMVKKAKTSRGSKSKSPPPRASTASDTKEVLEPTKDNAKMVFHELKAVTDTALTEAQNELNKAMDEVKAKSAGLEKRAKEQVDKLMAPLRKNLDELIATAKGKGFDIAKCQNFIDKFSKTRDDTLHNLTDSFNQEIAKAQGYVDDALNKNKKMEQDVNSIDQDIENCHGHKWVLETCYGGIIKKIRKETIEVPRRITENVNKTKALVSGVVPILEKSVANEVAKAEIEASKDVKDFEACASK